MIITIRGPSGSGKSHLARAVMDEYGVRASYASPGRARPAGYLLRRGSRPELAVLGHYEIANGGTDTLGRLEEIYAEVRRHDDAGRDVLYEGKCMGDGLRNVQQLIGEDRDVRVVYLSTPVNVCVKSVRSRGHSIAETSILRVAMRCSREFAALTSCESHCGNAIVVQKTRREAIVTLRAWLARR